MFVVWGGSKTGRLEKVAPVREEGTAVLLYLPSHWMESPNSRSSCWSFTGFNSYTHKSWRASFAPDFSCLCTPLDVWGCDSEGNRSEKPQCCAVQTWLSLCFYKGESGHCVFISFVFCKNMCLLLQRESRLDICAPAQLLIFVCCLYIVEALVSWDLPRNTTFKYKCDCCCCCWVIFKLECKPLSVSFPFRTSGKQSSRLDS